MKFIYKNIFLILLLVFSFSLPFCKEKKTFKSQENIIKYKEPLIRANKSLLENDIREINSFCKRKKWDISETQTGLRYSIYKKGKGIKAETGKIATIRYKVSLLNGRLCYSSDSLGLKSIKIGYEPIEKGLLEGILLMHEGDKAHLILHPGLAYGLIGDEKRIPPRSTIVYDVELVAVTDN